jgi:hypothetical protein
VYARLKSLVCGACVDEEEAEYRRIRDVIAEHPNSNAEIVAALADVDIRTVFRMLDSGLIRSDSAFGDTQCGNCGKPAISHVQRLCAECLMELDHRLNAHLLELRQVASQMRLARETKVHSTLQDKRRHGR